MYDTHLSLLAPEKRASIQKIITMQSVRLILEVFVLTLCVSGMTLIAGEWVMQSYFTSLVTSMTAHTSREQTYAGEQIKKINTILRNTESIQRVYTPWSSRVSIVASAVPAHIVLSSFSVDHSAQRFLITGSAVTRDDVLLLKSHLELLPFVQSVDIPLSQLTSRVNVPFSITVTTK